MNDLSHVGMLNCWICGKGADILLDRRLRKSLKQNMGSSPSTICSDCVSKSTEDDGMWVISIRDDQYPPSDDNEVWNPYRTGGLVLLKKDALRRIYSEMENSTKLLDIIEKNVYIYLNDKQWKMFGLPKLQSTKDPCDESYES